MKVELAPGGRRSDVLPKGRQRDVVRKRLYDYGLVLGLSLLLLVVAEAALRLGTSFWSDAPAATRISLFHDELAAALELYRLHPYLNTAPREGARVEAFGRRAAFNTLGYRSPERPLEKPPGVFRILCAGGSTTFDILAAGDETSWPWLLEQALRDHGFEVEVWNAGFPGWTSLENLVSLAIRDSELRPDLVVFFQGINDLQPASSQPFDRQYETGHAELSRRALGFELPPLRWHQRSLLLEKVRDQVVGPVDPWERVLSHPVPVQPEIPPAAVEVFERNLRSFQVLGRMHGARLLWVPQEIRLRAGELENDRRYLADWISGLEPEAVSGELEKLNEVMRRLGAEGPGRLLDPGYSEWPDAEWADPMHFSPHGSRRFARFLSAAVAPELLVPLEDRDPLGGQQILDGASRGSSDEPGP